MAQNNRKNFIYLNWRSSPHTNHHHHSDSRSTVQIMTSIGSYKNSFANFVMQKNCIYYWEIKIIQGTYFKVGIIKQDIIQQVVNKAFSDLPDGYAYFSTGQLRKGSNSTGTAFSTGYGPGDTIKVQFNSKEGNLKFAKNDEALRVAFTEADFKKGGFVPVVAALIEGSKFALTIPDLED